MNVSSYTNLSSYGFFGGVAPGCIYFLITLLRLRKVKAQAQEVAREQGEFLDFDSAENQSFDFMLNPQAFIKPTDGPGVRSGKNLLLSVRDSTWKRMRVAVIMTAVGLPIGLFVSTCAEYAIGRPWP
nr:hypothetical protein [Luteibacter rhizovicinus]